MTDPLDADGLAELESRIDEWIEELRSHYDHIEAVDRGEDDVRRWFVRMRGEEKDFTTAWLTLGQRMLKYETYVMPAPEESAQQLWENLLRRNDRLVGAHFSIGEEDAVYLRGELPSAAVTKADVDRILGTLYATVEQAFHPLLRIGFASRFAADGG
ncbi:YbjN domain-containing protein [Ilumatobacter sp.]|uniref:YbjN domain-containing protein n=1 Tax=Ilumatobacter sp. TaxID=1967498 RepID=UPI003B528DEF